ncbi:ATP-grasp domain-containing protein [Pontibacter pamirensis]|uniref:ATP-grasp domain-containing protein n=1 Tax=Pontibacter pamirensis TaxID=2562824 RepID=UPI001389C96E|nr:hypothetical protein [Pontibacter pamirensis]
MKIAIHHSEGSFSERWITYCQSYKIPYKLVNCYDTDIVNQVEDCDALMWHYHHANYKDRLFAKQLLFSIEQAGKVAFPNFNTAWHFDDKVGQKYLLESIGTPFVPSYAFYEKSEALIWIENTTYPKVFKLTGGAGSRNVKLVKNKKQAKSLVKRAFGRGFPAYDSWYYWKESVNKKAFLLNNFLEVLRGLKRGLFPSSDLSLLRNEKGYVYFQEFLPGNKSDVRIIVIGDNAFAIERYVRPNDFRASGSGRIHYLDDKDINLECLRIAFETSEKLKSKCLAYDFVLNSQGEPLIVEISYGFASMAYNSCKGYWNKDFTFFRGSFNPHDWMVECVIREINK